MRPHSSLPVLRLPRRRGSRLHAKIAVQAAPDEAVMRYTIPEVVEILVGPSAAILHIRAGGALLQLGNALLEGIEFWLEPAHQSFCECGHNAVRERGRHRLSRVAIAGRDQLLRGRLNHL